MARGDHFFVPLAGALTHHGIDIGDGTVVHWTSGLDTEARRGVRGVVRGKRNAEIRRTSLEYFAGGHTVRVRHYSQELDGDQVVRRALERVGERGYSLVWQNCEHFATWCKTDRHESRQVKKAAGIAAASARTAPWVPVAVRKGGRLPRDAKGGPIGKMAVLTTGGELAAAAVLDSILPDGDDLEPAERGARSAGRNAGNVGGAVGSAAAVVAVSTLGTPGLSAAGVATGMAAIGGGSALIGGVVIAALPLVCGVGAGLATYRLARAVRHRRSSRSPRLDGRVSHRSISTN